MITSPSTAFDLPPTAKRKSMHVADGGRNRMMCEGAPAHYRLPLGQDEGCGRPYLARYTHGGYCIADCERQNGGRGAS